MKFPDTPLELGAGEDFTIHRFTRRPAVEARHICVRKGWVDSIVDECSGASNIQTPGQEKWTMKDGFSYQRK
jgi:hypothetical protein